MTKNPGSRRHYNTNISRSIFVLGYEDGEVVILENGRIFRVSPQQARLRLERRNALDWLIAAFRYDPDAILEVLESGRSFNSPGRARHGD